MKACQEVTTPKVTKIIKNNNEPIDAGTSNLRSTGVLGAELSSIGIFIEGKYYASYILLVQWVLWVTMLA